MQQKSFGEVHNSLTLNDLCNYMARLITNCCSMYVNALKIESHNLIGLISKNSKTLKLLFCYTIGC